MQIVWLINMWQIFKLVYLLIKDFLLKICLLYYIDLRGISITIVLPVHMSTLDSQVIQLFWPTNQGTTYDHLLFYCYWEKKQKDWNSNLLSICLLHKPIITNQLHLDLQQVV